MPSKNHNARVNTVTRVLQAVPDTTPASVGRTAAEDKLWATLNAHPAATTANLAVLAGIGRSTAGKILAAWATEGSVTRSPGSAQGGRGGADTWTICEATVDHGTKPAVDQWPDVAVTDGSVPDTAPSATDNTSSEVADCPDRNAAEQPRFPGTPGADTVTPRDEGSEPAKAPRLGKGALRGMVEDYLAEHASEQFSPSAIGKALNRSSGAVNNALDKLVADGYAIQTQDKPKRFRINATASAAR
ncbi:MAG: MarR family transcriptional regulator [Pseudonocardiaceae bacterium]